MFIAGFPADAFGTNCYVVATAPGEECVVVDPGIGVTDRLDDVGLGRAHLAGEVRALHARC